MKRNLWRLRDTGFLARCAENNHDVLVTFNNSNDSILKIPPKAHFIWLGSKEMPSYAHMCINSFIRLHPAWAVKVWKDCDIESLGDFKNKSALLSCTNMGMRSDILRIEILRQQGGVYIDIDYEFVRSIDLLCLRSRFFCSFSNVPAFEVNNAIIGVCAGHPVLTLIADEISEKLQQHQKAAQLLVLLSSQISSFLSPDNLISLSPTPQTDYSFSDVISLTGPGMLTQVIGQVLDNGCRSAVVEYGMLLLPAHILNPVPNAARVDLNTMSDLPCRDIREVDVSRFAADCSSVECLEQANYFAAVSRNDSSLVDWTDYAALKEMFVLKPETSRTVMAVHWWQRSWQ